MTLTENESPQERAFDSLSGLLRYALGDDLISPDAETLVDMMTDDIVFEFPFPMPNGIQRIEGKTALEDYLPKVGAALTIETLALTRALISTDRTTATVEFSCKGCNKTSHARYDQNYVSVIDLRDGRISRYRDYWNPLIALAALGDSELVDSSPVVSSVDQSPPHSHNRP